MATLILNRPDEIVNEKGEMMLFLNGQSIGTLLNNERKTFDIPTGRHKLKAKIYTQGSKVYTFTVSDTGSKALVISTDNEANSPNPWITGEFIDFIVLPFQLLYYLTIGHNRYLTIKELK